MSGWSPRNWPLAIQLSLSFSLIALLALGGGGLLLANQVADRQLATRSALGLAQARLAANLASEDRFLQKPDELPLALFTFHQQSGVRPIVVDRTGQVVADSWIPSPLVGKALPIAEVEAALKGEEAVNHHQTLETGWLLYAATPIRNGNEVTGAVLVSASLNDLAAGLDEIQEQLLWALGVAGLLSVAAGFTLARYLAAPLERLWKAASAMGEGHLEIQVAISGSREVSELGRRFNAMAAELRRIDDQRRGFVSAASHELRTPIASIRALADALLADTSGNIDLYKECLTDIVHESDRARHLMNRLLELARLEARSSLSEGGETAQSQPLDLREICLDVIESLEPQAQEKGVSLSCQADSRYRVRTDGWLVETVLTNLVQNAVKYTPAGGEVRLHITEAPARTGDQARPEGGERIRQGMPTELRIAVADTGPGIPPEHLAHLFDRFYRVEGSRSRVTGGVGLGLSIAAEAARLLQGRIEVASTVGQGSRFTLVLPADPAEAHPDPHLRIM